MRLSLGALLRDVGRPPRDKEGEGWVRVVWMWRLFLLCVWKEDPSSFSRLPSLFSQEDERKRGKERLITSLSFDL